MKKLKLGQIGIGHNHGEAKMRAARKRDDLFEFTGYWEENEEWVKLRSDMEGYRGLKRRSLEEIIEESDVILVETDVWNLDKYAKMCIDAGKHIHMDKPAGGPLAEWKALLDEAKEKKLVVQMGYMYRYNPAIQETLRMIKDGEIGQIYSINAEMSTCHPDIYRNWLTNFQGGIMYILGSHLLDLIIYIMGEPDKVTTFLKHTNKGGIDYEDNNLAVLEYGASLARIFVSSVEVNGFGRRQFVVNGEKASVNIMPIERPTIMTYSDMEIATSEYHDLKKIVDVEDLNGDQRYDHMMQDLYDYVTGTKENPYTYEHDYTVQKVLYEICGGDSALKPGETGRPGYGI